MIVKVHDKHVSLEWVNLSQFFSETDPFSNHAPGEKECLSGDSSWRYGSGSNLEKYLANRFNGDVGKESCEKEVKKYMNSAEFKNLVALATTFKKRLKFSEIGTKVDVPRAISGDDSIFRSFSNARKKVVRLAVNVTASYLVSPEDWIKLAKRVIPLIYCLEIIGLSVQVDLIEVASGVFRDAPKKVTLYKVPVKTAAIRFSWTTFAPIFQIGTFRDSLFRAAYRSPWNPDSGLGTPMYNPEPADYDYDAIYSIQQKEISNGELLTELFKKVKHY